MILLYDGDSSSSSSLQPPHSDLNRWGESGSSDKDRRSFVGSISPAAVTFLGGPLLAVTLMRA